MVLFSRSFIRKRAVSIAVAVSVAAASLALAHGPTSAHRFHGTVPVQYVVDRNNSVETFQSESQSAMNKMMAGMTVKPIGDVDRDFVAMMIPHHQAAIDMAQAELKYGHNELLRRLAREIVVNQRQEITVMRLAVDDERPVSAASPVQPAPSSNAPPTAPKTMGMSH
jgi:uncharacterized protein (DUF305 family)